MKDEEILQLVSYYLTLHPIDENKPENLLKFARALYKEGYDDGYDKGYDKGYYKGYDNGTFVSKLPLPC
jgi:flagellar biosynthesis/type III secretory pathway protein FliH